MITVFSSDEHGLHSVDLPNGDKWGTKDGNLQVYNTDNKMVAEFSSYQWSLVVDVEAAGVEEALRAARASSS